MAWIGKKASLVNKLFLYNLLLLCLVMESGHAQAQNIILKTGQSIVGKNLRRSGATILTRAQLGVAEGDVGYPVANIAKIEFPEPPEIAEATELLMHGSAAEALAKINPVVIAQSNFKDIPGNWWAKAARVKLSALSTSPASPDSELLISDMLNASGDPEVVLYARVRQAANLAGKGNAKQAIAVCDAVIKESKQPATLAEAWAVKGTCLLQQNEYDSALLALLHLPVYYPDQKLLMPGVLLKCARAYTGNEDFTNATATLEDLIKTYPGSPEAAQAKVELKKIENKSSSKPTTNS